MPTVNLSAVLDKLKLRLTQKLGDNLLLVTLYGSYARQEAGKNSDVDILIVLKRLSKKNESLIEQIVYDLMREINFAYFLSVNLVDQAHYRNWKRQDASLLRNILQEGRVLWATN